jgi:hypothetical protein
MLVVLVLLLSLLNTTVLVIAVDVDTDVEVEAGPDIASPSAYLKELQSQQNGLSDSMTDGDANNNNILIDTTGAAVNVIDINDVLIEGSPDIAVALVDIALEVSVEFISSDGTVDAVTNDDDDSTLNTRSEEIVVVEANSRGLDRAGEHANEDILTSVLENSVGDGSAVGSEEETSAAVAGDQAMPSSEEASDEYFGEQGGEIITDESDAHSSSTESGEGADDEAFREMLEQALLEEAELLSEERLMAEESTARDKETAETPDAAAGRSDEEPTEQAEASLRPSLSSYGKTRGSTLKSARSARTSAKEPQTASSGPRDRTTLSGSGASQRKAPTDLPVAGMDRHFAAAAGVAEDESEESRPVDGDDEAALLRRFRVKRRYARPVEAILRRSAADPYTVLGVPRESTFADLKRAFRSTVVAVHPDKNPHPVGKL